MKNFLLITTLLVISLSGLKAQVALPEGMRYQAIARANDGTIRSKEALTVKAELLVLDKEDEVVYSEIQSTTSGEFGLINITIGEGNSIIGTFAKIPWSKQLWVRISIKNADNDDYQLVTISKLYSVPYAFYAASAGSLTDRAPGDDGGNDSNNRGLGGDLDQTSIYWTLDGNTNAHKYKGGGPPVLGTTDRKDLVFITKNIPRLIIDKDGNINFLTNIDLDGDLNVDGNTTLNGSLDVTNMKPTHLSGTLLVDKATTLNSSLNVENMSPTFLSGLLNVEKTLTVKGATTLNNTLDVTSMSPTHLSGTLAVDKATTLNSSLTVTSLAPTNLTGLLDVDKTLNVDGASTLNSSLDVTGMNPTRLAGTLTVDKATTLNSSLTVTNMSPTNLTGLLDVDKTLNVDGATTLNSSLDVTNASPTHLTGLLDVDKTMNVDGASTLNGTLDVTGMNATRLTGTLAVDKATTLKAALTVTNAAPTHLTGSLDVDGAFAADGDIKLDGPLTVGGMNPTTLSGTLEVGKLATMKAGLIVKGDGTVGPNGDHLAFFDNTEGGATDGVAIRIQNNTTTAANNFVTFYKGDNSIAGRIEGYVLNDIGTPPIPTSDEIWTAICIAIADYNPVTLFWTQFANQFNFVGNIWNASTIPGFTIPDFPGLTLPNFNGLTTPDFPGVDIPDFPGFGLPSFPGVDIPDIPAVSIPDVGTVFGGLTIPNIPGFDVPDVPGFVIPNIPGFAIVDIPAFDIPDIPPFTIPDFPTLNLKNDLFEWPEIPTFSDILQDEGVCPNAGIFDMPNGYVFRLIDWAVQNDMQNMISFSPIDLAAKVLTWGVTKVAKVGGVTYGSKGADYAEYLPKLYTTEKFLSGEIVGVHGGKISKVTTGADQILAISTNPLVLGNQPDEEQQNDFAKVGFLGQVPVFVQGPVELGDYIVPSGKNDGIGKVIKANELTAAVLPEIFGTAWSASPLETTTVINVSIGLRPTEIAEVLKQREQNLKSLQQQINDQNAIHSELKADVDMLKTYFDLEAKPSAKRTN